LFGGASPDGVQQTLPLLIWPWQQFAALPPDESPEGAQHCPFCVIAWSQQFCALPWSACPDAMQSHLPPVRIPEQQSAAEDAPAPTARQVQISVRSAVPLQQLAALPMSLAPGAMQREGMASRPASSVPVPLLDARLVPDACVLEAELVPVPVLVLEPASLPEPASPPT
jgi:hypothetical protein